MQVNQSNIADSAVTAITQHYRHLIEKAGEAAGPLGLGRESQEYLVALSLITATVTAVQHCYGFASAHEAHNWIKKVLHG